MNQSMKQHKRLSILLYILIFVLFSTSMPREHILLFFMYEDNLSSYCEFVAADIDWVYACTFQNSVALMRNSFSRWYEMTNGQ